MITVGSWETRFLKGFEGAVKKFRPHNVVLFFYKEYATWSAKNRRESAKLCKEQGIIFKDCELSFSKHKDLWNVLYGIVTHLNVGNGCVLLDITTMPRETIWIMLDLLDARGIMVKYVYNQPERYNPKWLSRDPDEPRLVYKLSGEPKMGIPTKLLVLTGYDVDRVRQLIRFFQPQETLLGLQTGNQLANQAFNVEKSKRAFEKERAIDFFEVDAYAADHGFNSIKTQLDAHIGNSNMIMSSLGPKLSAISLYKLHKIYPQTSLAYAPSKEFNRRYSYGVGLTHEGHL
jgi:uncharacterized protein Veg